MKFLVVLPLLVAVSLATPAPYVPYVPAGYANADTYEEFLEQVKEANAATGSKTTGDRIASGTEVKKGEWPDFCYLNIGFFQKQQMCGCWIIDKQYVVTSARCLVDCSEGRATNITVNFPQLSGKDAIMTVERFFIPDDPADTMGNNKNMEFPAAYSTITDGGTSGNFRTIGPSNMALIKLSGIILGDETKFKASKDVRAAKYDMAAPDIATWTTNHPTSTWKFRACGLGVIGNKGERAKGVVCTDINIVSNDKCFEASTNTAIAPPPGSNQICLHWPDRDNNICVGDFGGAVYAYKLMPDGKTNDIPNQEVVCTTIGSPNVRSNAQCLDGHVIFCEMFIGGLPNPTTAAMSSAIAWASNIITPGSNG